MEIEYFDIAIEGTTLASHHETDPTKKTIVIEPTNNYGSTYTSIDKLENSPYIKNLQIHTNHGEYVVIEALPCFIKNNNKVAEKYRKKPYGGQMEFVDIFNVFFISKQGKIIKLFNNKTDIVNSDILEDEDRFYLFDSLKKQDFSIFKDHLIRKISESQPNIKTPQDNLIHKVFLQYELFDTHLITHFARVPYIYPVYGSSELCENISLINSLNGSIYLLSKDIKSSKSSEHEGYNHKFECEYGVIYSKDLIKNNLVEKSYYVKTILLKNSKFSGNFIAYIESTELIKVFSLDSKAKVCAPGHQLMYFIKEHNPITQDDIDILMINSFDILLDLDFTTKYDINGFS